MTTDLFDPNDEDDDLMVPLDPESADLETDDDDEIDGTTELTADEPVQGHFEQDLVPDADILQNDVEGAIGDRVPAGNLPLEATGKQSHSPAVNELPLDPTSPRGIREAFSSMTRPGAIGPQKLPGVQEPEGNAIELLSTERAGIPPQAAETPPVVVHHLPPQIGGGENSSAEEGRERLRIEIEITLANAERISRIAVEEAKAEFKKLASQATQRLDEKFYEYRANQRLLRRG